VLDGGGTHQNGLAAFVAALDIGDDGIPLFPARPVNQVGKIPALNGAVGGDDHHFQAINLIELKGLGIGGAGHAGEFSYMRK